MTSPTATTVHHYTFWCHECDMSISIPPPAPALCPHCHHDFLEQLDSFTLPPLHTNSTSNATAAAAAAVAVASNGIDDPNIPLFPFPLPPPSTSATPADDNFLLSSPYLQRLIHYLTTTASANVTPPSPHNPTSKSFIKTLQTVTVAESDNLCCPVCRDQIAVDAMVLPCQHLYHESCILQWLETSSTCPLCRYKLPSQVDYSEQEMGSGETFVGAFRIEELLDDEVELFSFSSTLRNIARRHQESSDESAALAFTPTQLAEDEGAVERANSTETVSSWPVWQVERGIHGDGDGNGNLNDNANA